MKWNLKNETIGPLAGSVEPFNGSLEAGVLSTSTMSMRLDHPNPVAELPDSRPERCAWISAIATRIDSFLDLTADWDGYDAASPRADIVGSANAFIFQIAHDVNPVEPTAFPTRNGGVLVVWKFESHRLELEFSSPETATFVYVGMGGIKSVKGNIPIGQIGEHEPGPFWEILSQHFAS